LAEAVQWAARSLPTRPSVPILAGLLVRADASGVVLSSFDYETSAQITVKAEVADEGEALVSGRLLADISRSLPAKPVDISADGNHVELVCGSARFTLQTLPVADYPTLPSLPEATGTVPSDVFAHAVAQVVVAAGRDELLPVFTGVRVEIEGETVSLLATDRYRMALRELTWNPAAPQISAAARRVSLVAERNTSLRMLIGDGVVTLEAATGDQAQASEALEAVVEQPGGGDQAVTAAGFNPTYLLDALGAFDTPYVNFAFTAPSKPCQLTGLAELDGDPITDYRHVIMLMRLPS